MTQKDTHGQAQRHNETSPGVTLHCSLASVRLPVHTNRILAASALLLPSPPPVGFPGRLTNTHNVILPRCIPQPPGLYRPTFKLSVQRAMFKYRVQRITKTPGNMIRSGLNRPCRWHSLLQALESKSSDSRCHVTHDTQNSCHAKPNTAPPSRSFAPKLPELRNR